MAQRPVYLTVRGVTQPRNLDFQLSQYEFRVESNGTYGPYMLEDTIQHSIDTVPSDAPGWEYFQLPSNMQGVPGLWGSGRGIFQFTDPNGSGSSTIIAQFSY